MQKTPIHVFNLIVKSNMLEDFLDICESSNAQFISNVEKIVKRQTFFDENGNFFDMQECYYCVSFLLPTIEDFEKYCELVKHVCYGN